MSRAPERAWRGVSAEGEHSGARSGSYGQVGSTQTLRVPAGLSRETGAQYRYQLQKRGASWPCCGTLRSVNRVGLPCVWSASSSALSGAGRKRVRFASAQDVWCASSRSGALSAVFLRAASAAGGCQVSCDSCDRCASVLRVEGP